MDDPIGLRDGHHPGSERSLGQVAQSIAADAAALVRKEVELARQEVVEAVTARLKAAGALAAAGFFGLFAFLFLAAAAASALDLVVAAWASRLIVAGGFLAIAAAAVGFGVTRMKRPPLAPELAKRRVKEDLEWAKTQLRR